MPPDPVRARIAPSLRLIAAEGGAAAICSPSGEVEVCVGNIEPYLDAVAGVSGITLIAHGGLQVVSYPLVGGYRLVATADVESLGNVIGACHKYDRSRSQRRGV